MVGLDGSPFGTTDVLASSSTARAFGNQSASIQNFGMGSALATLLFLFIVVFASMLTLWLRRREIQFAAITSDTPAPAEILRLARPGHPDRELLHHALSGRVMVLSAFKTTGEIFEHPFALPDFTQVGNFAKVLGETAMPTYFMNSILVTGTSVVLILVLGTMAGYAVARCESRTNTFILLFFLAGLMLP